MKAVILVGGEGTRLLPLTLARPKPLVPVANRPFLEHVLARLARHGIEEVILTTGYMAEAFEALPASQTHGVKLTVVREESPLGTCGAVKNVASMLQDTFLVLNGDILTDLDLTELVAYHRKNGALGTLTLSPVRDPSAYGLVPIDESGRIERFIEKPRSDEIVTDLINAGTYVLEPQTLERAPAGENYSFERGLFPSLLSEGAPLYGFRSTVYWLDLGTPDTYLRANRDVLEGRVGEPPPGDAADRGIWKDAGAEIAPEAELRAPVALGKDCRLEPESKVLALSVLGDGCRIGPGAVVDESVLHPGVTLEEGAVVERSVLGPEATVGRGCRLSDVIVGEGARIGANNELRAGLRLWPGVELPQGAVRF